MNANRVLENLAVASLEKCVAKLSRISAGRWSLAEVRVSWGPLTEIALRRPSGGVAVYFEVSGDTPFTAMIIFQPGDIEIISKSFLGFAFPRMAAINQAEELLLSELGNIILNSFVGALSNVLKRGFIPSVPKLIKGEPQFLLEAIESTLDKGQEYSLVSIMVDLQCEHTVTSAEVVGIVPGKLTEDLEAAAGNIK